MVISERLNEHKLKEILLNIYVKEMQTENIGLEEVIEEIKKQLLTDCLVNKE